MLVLISASLMMCWAIPSFKKRNCHSSCVLASCVLTLLLQADKITQCDIQGRLLLCLFVFVAHTKSEKDKHRTSRNHKLCSHQACSIFTSMSNCVVGHHFEFCNKSAFLNFCTVSLTEMKLSKSRKGHCSSPLVG